MDRPAKSKVRHGTASCARYGCKLELCLQAQLKDRRRRNAERALTGEGAKVDAGKTSKHVNQLIRAGMSPVDIAEKSGVSVTRVRAVRSGMVGSILRATSEALLGVKVPIQGCRPVTDGFTDATGSMRRLRALAVQGFSLGFTSRLSQIPLRTMEKIRVGHTAQTKISLARKIATLHDLYWDEEPGDHGLSSSAVTRARAYAREVGWYPTEAWSDIDEPSCLPIVEVPRTLALAENAYELMGEQGYGLKDAAERLQVAPHVLQYATAKHGDRYPVQ